MTTTSIPSARLRVAGIRARHLVVGALVTMLVLVTIYLAVGAYAASQVTQIDTKRPHGADTPATFGLAYSGVRYLARGDGLEIAGWYIPAPDSTHAMILPTAATPANRTPSPAASSPSPPPCTRQATAY